MNASLIVKLCIVLPLILFVDYIIMVLLGCATCLFGFGTNYFCNSYCIIGKIILGSSLVFFLFFILPDIRALFKMKKNGATAEK